MMGGKSIPLFYWSSVLFENKTKENYGDLLSKYIVEQVSKRAVRFYHAPKKKKSWFKATHLLAIGSIISYATTKSIVWGSGIISKKDQFGNAKFCAVRGPETRTRVLELGYSCPEIYGDPALLLPLFHAPKVVKKYAFGIIPHYIDYKDISDLYKNDNRVVVIDLLSNDLEQITNLILSCEKTISTSLHGIIVSHAYNIPSIWLKYSDRLTGDDVKFRDYFLSVGITPYSGLQLAQDEHWEDLWKRSDDIQKLPNHQLLESVQKGLLESFPKKFRS